MLFIPLMAEQEVEKTTEVKFLDEDTTIKNLTVDKFISWYLRKYEKFNGDFYIGLDSYGEFLYYRSNRVDNFYSEKYNIKATTRYLLYKGRLFSLFNEDNLYYKFFFNKNGELLMRVQSDVYRSALADFYLEREYIRSNYKLGFKEYIGGDKRKLLLGLGGV